MVRKAVVTVIKAAVAGHPEIARHPGIARAPAISPAIHPAPLLPGTFYDNEAPT